MNSKTKLTLTVTAMVMVTLIAVVSIIAVFAARTQNFSSNITVRYTASQIAGKVSAKYYIGPDDTTGTAMTTTGREDGETELVFRPGDKQLDPNTLNPLEDIILDVEDSASNIPDKSWVVFEYVFQNGLGTKVDTDYIAKLTFNGTADNVVVTTNTAGTKIDQSQFSTITSSISTPASFTSSMRVYHNPEENYITTKYFYVKVAIDAIGASSTFTGNFTWDLTQAPSPTLDKLTFTLAGGDHYSVKQKDSSVSGNIVIPSTYTGEDGVERPVTEITYSAFSNNSNITGAIIPDSVQVIQNQAFYYTGLTSIVIPDSVITINRSAFNGCDKLKSVTIGTNVKDIGSEAFAYCTALTTINYNATDATDLTDNSMSFSNVGQNSTGITVTIGDNVTRIPVYLFGGYYSIGDRQEPNITDLIIGENVKTIGEHSFYNCKGITKLTFGKRVEEIGVAAFLGCSGLTNLELPISVTTIGEAAFADCGGIKTLTIPSSVTSIERDAFDSLSSLTTLNYNANILTDFNNGYTPFQSAGRDGEGVSLTIGEDVEHIPAYLFYTYLDSWSLKITSITIPENVTSIGKMAFANLAYLTTLNFNAIEMSDLTKDSDIFGDAGKSGTGIVVTIGNNVRHIPSYLLRTYSTGDPNVISLTIGNSVENIGAYAFLLSKIVTLTIPSSVKSIGQIAFACSSLEEIIIDSEEVCANLLSWGTNIEDNLKVGAKIKAINEIPGLLEWQDPYSSRGEHFTKSESQENGYWVYTKGE